MFLIKYKRINVFNKIILLGNLTRDVEVRYSSSNLAIGNTGIATSKKFKNQMGEEKEEVMFLDMTFFGRTAEIANQYLKKGSKVLVDGRLKLDQWTDKSGQKRSKHSLVVESMKMLGGKGKVVLADNFSNTKTYADTPQVKNNTQSTEQTPTELSFDESNIPF